MGGRHITRREVFGVLGAAGAALAVGCGSESPTSPTATGTGGATTATGGATSGACVVSPQETVGPYPSLADLIRSDIREGRSGTPVALTLTVVNVNSACSPVANAVIAIWQCDADGHYSQYNQPGYNGTAQTFLRGIQATDSSGQVTFTTVYPGWYAGRATHIHVEVTVNGRSVKVTQIAFPETVNNEVYRSGVYAARGQNPTSNTGDMVFADSLQSELASVSGNPTAGYTATFTVGISV